MTYHRDSKLFLHGPLSIHAKKGMHFPPSRKSSLFTVFQPAIAELDTPRITHPWQ